MASKPTQRTIAELKRLGFGCEIVEKWNPFVKRRQDFAGCIDIIAWKPGVGLLLIQTTSGDNHAARRAKICANDKIRGLMDCDARVEIWSWDLRSSNGRGSRKVWTLRRDEIRVDELTSDVNGPALLAG